MLLAFFSMPAVENARLIAALSSESDTVGTDTFYMFVYALLIGTKT